jgi:carbonic anhydrase
MLKKLILTGFIGISSLIASDNASSIPASQALQMLKDGNQRFIDGKSIHPHSDFERIKEVAKGQKPFVTINSCSDSRVPPELIFDQGFGDVFVVRNAGNVSDTDEVGTIEYGTEHLGTNLVIVMGHTNYRIFYPPTSDSRFRWSCFVLK